MATILASRLSYYVENEEGNKTAIPLVDINGIKNQIDKHVKNKKRLVWVANNPDNFEGNDSRSRIMFESFNLTWGKEFFSEKIVLDHRNSLKAKQILQNADVIILCGGKCLCQMNFFNEINLKSILKKCQGLVICISAGTMNLCKTFFNFPEEKSDLDEPRWFEGMGFCNDVIIPHFDGETLSYQIPCEEIDVVNDFVLPASHQKDFVGLPNGSYILLDENGSKNFFGTIYKISKGKVTKIHS